MMRKLVPSFSDSIAVAGLAMLWYGLFQFIPWLSFSVVGSLLIIAGVRLGRSEVSE